MNSKYIALSLQVAEIDKNLRAYRIRSVLEKLALNRNKSKKLIKIEMHLEAELMRPMRNSTKIDDVLEELECTFDN